MPYAVRERSGPDPIVTIDLFGRVVDEHEDGPVAGPGGETMGVGREISMELGALLEVLSTAGQKFVVVNGSRMEALGPSCAMALCAYGHRLARAGGALVCCAFPPHLGRMVEMMPTLYGQTEAEGIELCRAQEGSSGILSPGALEVKSRELDHGITVLSLTGGYWSEPAYSELVQAVRKTRTEGLIFEGSALTAFAPRGVGSLIKLIKELQGRKTRFCWCQLKALPGTFLSGSGLMNLFPYFDTLEQAVAALRAGPVALPPVPDSPKFDEEPLEIDDLDDIDHFNKLRSENPARNLTERYLYFISINPTLAKQRFSFVPTIAKQRFTTVEVPEKGLIYSVGWWYSHSYPDLMLVARSPKASMEKLRKVLERIGEGLKDGEPADYQTWINNPAAFLAPRIEHLGQLAEQAMRAHDLDWEELLNASPEFLERYPYAYGWEFYLQFADESLVPLLMSEAH